MRSGCLSWTLIQGSDKSILATIEAFVYYPQVTTLIIKVLMNGFVYAISSILLALLTVVAIDAYLIFIASTPGQ
jgi:hypothetical protein